MNARSPLLHKIIITAVVLVGLVSVVEAVPHLNMSSIHARVPVTIELLLEDSDLPDARGSTAAITRKHCGSPSDTVWEAYTLRSAEGRYFLPDVDIRTPGMYTVCYRTSNSMSWERVVTELLVCGVADSSYYPPRPTLAESAVHLTVAGKCIFGDQSPDANLYLVQHASECNPTTLQQNVHTALTLVEHTHYHIAHFIITPTAIGNHSLCYTPVQGHAFVVAGLAVVGPSRSFSPTVISVHTPVTLEIPGYELTPLLDAVLITTDFTCPHKDELDTASQRLYPTMGTASMATAEMTMTRAGLFSVCYYLTAATVIQLSTLSVRGAEHVQIAGATSGDVSGGAAPVPALVAGSLYTLTVAGIGLSSRDGFFLTNRHCESAVSTKPTVWSAASSPVAHSNLSVSYSVRLHIGGILAVCHTVVGTTTPTTLAHFTVRGPARRALALDAGVATVAPSLPVEARVVGYGLSPNDELMVGGAPATLRDDVAPLDDDGLVAITAQFSVPLGGDHAVLYRCHDSEAVVELAAVRAVGPTRMTPQQVPIGTSVALTVSGVSLSVADDRITLHRQSHDHGRPWTGCHHDNTTTPADITLVPSSAVSESALAFEVILHEVDAYHVCYHLALSAVYLGQLFTDSGIAVSPTEVTAFVETEIKVWSVSDGVDTVRVVLGTHCDEHGTLFVLPTNGVSVNITLPSGGQFSVCAGASPVARITSAGPVAASLHEALSARPLLVTQPFTTRPFDVEGPPGLHKAMKYVLVLADDDGGDGDGCTSNASTVSLYVKRTSDDPLQFILSGVVPRAGMYHVCLCSASGCHRATAAGVPVLGPMMLDNANGVVDVGVPAMLHLPGLGLEERDWMALSTDAESKCISPLIRISTEVASNTAATAIIDVPRGGNYTLCYYMAKLSQFVRLGTLPVRGARSMLPGRAETNTVTRIVIDGFGLDPVGSAVHIAQASGAHLKDEECGGGDAISPVPAASTTIGTRLVFEHIFSEPGVVGVCFFMPATSRWQALPGEIVVQGSTKYTAVPRTVAASTVASLIFSGTNLNRDDDVVLVPGRYAACNDTHSFSNAATAQHLGVRDGVRLFTVHNVPSADQKLFTATFHVAGYYTVCYRKVKSNNAVFKLPPLRVQGVEGVVPRALHRNHTMRVTLNGHNLSHRDEIYMVPAGASASERRDQPCRNADRVKAFNVEAKHHIHHDAADVEELLVEFPQLKTGVYYLCHASAVLLSEARDQGRDDDSNDWRHPFPITVRGPTGYAVETSHTLRAGADIQIVVEGIGLDPGRDRLFLSPDSPTPSCDRHHGVYLARPVEGGANHTSWIVKVKFAGTFTLCYQTADDALAAALDDDADASLTINGPVAVTSNTQQLHMGNEVSLTMHGPVDLASYMDEFKFTREDCGNPASTAVRVLRAMANPIGEGVTMIVMFPLPGAYVVCYASSASSFVQIGEIVVQPLSVTRVDVPSLDVMSNDAMTLTVYGRSLHSSRGLVASSHASCSPDMMATATVHGAETRIVSMVPNAVIVNVSFAEAGNVSLCLDISYLHDLHNVTVPHYIHVATFSVSSYITFYFPLLEDVFGSTQPSVFPDMREDLVATPCTEIAAVICYHREGDTTSALALARFVDPPGSTAGPFVVDISKPFTLVFSGGGLASTDDSVHLVPWGHPCDAERVQDYARRGLLETTAVTMSAGYGLRWNFARAMLWVPGRYTVCYSTASGTMHQLEAPLDAAPRVSAVSLQPSSYVVAGATVHIRIEGYALTVDDQAFLMRALRHTDEVASDAQCEAEKGDGVYLPKPVMLRQENRTTSSLQERVVGGIEPGRYSVCYLAVQHPEKMWTMLPAQLSVATARDTIDHATGAVSLPNGEYPQLPLIRPNPSNDGRLVVESDATAQITATVLRGVVQVEAMDDIRIRKVTLSALSALSSNTTLEHCIVRPAPPKQDRGTGATSSGTASPEHFGISIEMGDVHILGSMIVKQPVAVSRGTATLHSTIVRSVTSSSIAAVSLVDSSARIANSKFNGNGSPLLRMATTGHSANVTRHLSVLNVVFANQSRDVPVIRVEGVRHATRWTTRVHVNYSRFDDNVGVVVSVDEGHSIDFNDCFFNVRNPCSQNGNKTPSAATFRLRCLRGLPAGTLSSHEDDPELVPEYRSFTWYDRDAAGQCHATHMMCQFAEHHTQQQQHRDQRAASHGPALGTYAAIVSVCALAVLSAVLTLVCRCIRPRHESDQHGHASTKKHVAHLLHEISPNDVHELGYVVDGIGGGEGRVTVARYGRHDSKTHSEDSPVLVKQHHSEASFRREAEVLGQLALVGAAQHVVAVHGCLSHDRKIILHHYNETLLEYMRRGTLNTVRGVASVCDQITSVMVELQGRLGRTHGAVRLDNVFVDPSNHYQNKNVVVNVVVANFGSDVSEKLEVSIGYAPPESSALTRVQSDIFSFGVCVACMLDPATNLKGLGRPPRVAVLARALSSQSFSSLRFASLIDRCLLQRKPLYTSWAEVREDVEALVADVASDVTAMPKLSAAELRGRLLRPHSLLGVEVNSLKKGKAKSNDGTSAAAVRNAASLGLAVVPSSFSDDDTTTVWDIITTQLAAQQKVPTVTSNKKTTTKSVPSLVLEWLRSHPDAPVSVTGRSAETTTLRHLVEDVVKAPSYESYLANTLLSNNNVSCVVCNYVSLVGLAHCFDVVVQIITAEGEHSGGGCVVEIAPTAKSSSSSGSGGSCVVLLVHMGGCVFRGVERTMATTTRRITRSADDDAFVVEEQEGEVDLDVGDGGDSVATRIATTIQKKGTHSSSSDDDDSDDSDSEKELQQQQQDQKGDAVEQKRRPQRWKF
eukprot:PhM_4_TR18039/c0_g1_i1/m.21308